MQQTRLGITALLRQSENYELLSLTFCLVPHWVNPYAKGKATATVFVKEFAFPARGICFAKNGKASGKPTAFFSKIEFCKLDKDCNR